MNVDPYIIILKHEDNNDTNIYAVSYSKIETIQVKKTDILIKIHFHSIRESHN